MAGKKQNPNLPPAGFSRDEELKRRKDDLDQKGEELSEKREHYAMNPKALEPINEIQHSFNNFNELAVSNADPSYTYCWVQSSFNGLFVKLKMAERWEVVQGDMAEAAEHRGIAADSTRRVGDVILMRMRKDYYIQLVRHRKDQHERRKEGISSNLQQLGEKYRDLGVDVRVPEDGSLSPQDLDRMAQRSQAAAQSQKTTDRWIREGRMPGVPIPGREVDTGET